MELKYEMLFGIFQCGFYSTYLQYALFELFMYYIYIIYVHMYVCVQEQVEPLYFDYSRDSGIQ